MDDFSYVMYVKNLGITPARSISYKEQIAIVDKETFDPKKPLIYASSQRNTLTDDDNAFIPIVDIGSQDQYPLTLRPLYKFSKDEWKEFSNGIDILLVGGAVYYDDIYGHEHFTRFCYYFEFSDLTKASFCNAGSD